MASCEQQKKCGPRGYAGAVCGRQLHSKLNITEKFNFIIIIEFVSML